jgi:hypothetical protein
MNSARLRRVVTLALATVLAAGAAAVSGPAPAANIGNEGCTPGYWKNHTSNWEEYRTNSLLGNNFVIPDSLASFRTQTFLQALQGGGGPGLTGAAQILFRASVAAYLNAAHEGVGYPYRRFMEPGFLEQQINAALASEDRQTMLDLAAFLDEANNLGCPLN